MKVKTHLIVTDQYDSYEVKWLRRLIDLNPALSDKGLPIYVIISNMGRIEVSTIDTQYIETLAKRRAYPKGRGAFTSDVSRIYVKERDKETCVAIVRKNHIREYAPMFDEISLE